MTTRVHVLGASGYLGAAVARAVEIRGAEVVRLRGVEGLGDTAPGDALVNCVGRYDASPAELEAANVGHAARAAEAAAARRLRLVHVSSSAVFDGIARGVVCETTAPSPRSAYGRSKLAGERAVIDRVPEAQLLRPAKVFGGDDPRARLHALVRHVAGGGGLPQPERDVLWANFVPVGSAAYVVAEEALRPSAPVVHLACACRWDTFVDLLGRAVDRRVRRIARPLEAGLAVAAPLLGRAPAGRLPRRAERVVELWDRRSFRDSRGRVGEDRLLEALREVRRAVE